MPEYDVTTIEYSELDILETQITAIVAALGVAQAAIEATVNADIQVTRDPDSTAVALATVPILAEIKDTMINTPVNNAMVALKDAINLIVEDLYEATPV